MTIQSPIEALREGGNYRAAKSWQEKKEKKSVKCVPALRQGVSLENSIAEFGL
jgi:hypothetical protein